MNYIQGGDNIDFTKHIYYGFRYLFDLTDPPPPQARHKHKIINTITRCLPNLSISIYIVYMYFDEIINYILSIWKIIQSVSLIDKTTSKIHQHTCYSKMFKNGYVITHHVLNFALLCVRLYMCVCVWVYAFELRTQSHISTHMNEQPKGLNVFVFSPNPVPIILCIHTCCRYTSNSIQYFEQQMPIVSIWWYVVICHIINWDWKFGCCCGCWMVVAVFWQQKSYCLYKECSIKNKNSIYFDRFAHIIIIIEYEVVHCEWCVGNFRIRNNQRIAECIQKWRLM